MGHFSSDAGVHESSPVDFTPNSPGSMSSRLTSAQTANPATAIIVQVPMSLRTCCAGASELALPAASLRAVLEELERRHPALHRSVCDETGTVRRHVNLFVNSNHMRDCN